MVNGYGMPNRLNSRHRLPNMMHVLFGPTQKQLLYHHSREFNSVERGLRERLDGELVTIF
jgi:hypothetical protein